MATRRAPERTQRERTEATTGQLIGAARRLFAADGYQATSLEDVVAAAGVTKGALYHHFAGKRELFRAVFEREEQELARACHAAYARKRDPWEGFYEGCRAFVEAVLDPGVQRIALLDAPAVLGWETVREVQRNYAMAMVRNGLEEAIRSGRIAERPVDSLAHLLFGALCEGAMVIARAPDQRAAGRDLLRELRAMLTSLETTGKTGAPPRA
jgi:AcrR family transcriptional regulator